MGHAQVAAVADKVLGDAVVVVACPDVLAAVPSATTHQAGSSTGGGKEHVRADPKDFAAAFAEFERGGCSFRCCLCDIKLGDYLALSDHVLEAHPDMTKQDYEARHFSDSWDILTKWRCKICRKKFPFDRAYIVGHLDVHGLELEEYFCKFEYRGARRFFRTKSFSKSNVNVDSAATDEVLVAVLEGHAPVAAVTDEVRVDAVVVVACPDEPATAVSVATQQAGSRCRLKCCLCDIKLTDSLNLWAHVLAAHPDMAMSKSNGTVGSAVSVGGIFDKSDLARFYTLLNWPCYTPFLENYIKMCHERQEAPDYGAADDIIICLPALKAEGMGGLEMFFAKLQEAAETEDKGDETKLMEALLWLCPALPIIMKEETSRLFLRMLQFHVSSVTADVVKT